MRKNYKAIFEAKLGIISGLTGIPKAVPYTDKSGMKYITYTFTNGFYHLVIMQDSSVFQELTPTGYTASEFDGYLEGMLKGLQFKR